MNVLEKKTSKINHLSIHLRKLEKKSNLSLESTRNEIIEIRAEINEIRNRKTIEKIRETKSWSFRKINKINKPLAKLNHKNEKRHKQLV